MEKVVTYDVNSHIFQTYIKNGSIDPYTDIIVYDGGNLDEEPTELEEEED